MGMQGHLAIEQAIVPSITGLGYIFVGLELHPQGRGKSLIRLYIDKSGGVTIDDCAIVARQVNALLGVESPIQGDYTLEVSSPGMDRRLFTKAQFEEQLGKLVAIKLLAPRGDRRNFKGRLRNVAEDEVVIELEDSSLTFTFAEMAEARLVPEW